ncbi:hypothetical protein ID866_1498 [Astraeus odoratus]|nr:hypothetical protein ID866_1498 [Astraeus odoratus]
MSMGGRVTTYFTDVVALDTQVHLGLNQDESNQIELRDSRAEKSRLLLCESGGS